MFAKIQKYLENKQKQLEQKQNLIKAKQFYSFIKAGCTFVKFVQEDLERQGDDMNRHERRRFQKELTEKGTFTPELINYYQLKIDWLLGEVNKRMNQPKPIQSNNPNVRVQTEKPKDV